MYLGRLLKGGLRPPPWRRNRPLRSQRRRSQTACEPKVGPHLEFLLDPRHILTPKNDILDLQIVPREAVDLDKR